MLLKNIMMILFTSDYKKYNFVIPMKIISRTKSLTKITILQNLFKKTSTSSNILHISFKSIKNQLELRKRSNSRQNFSLIPNQPGKPLRRKKKNLRPSSPSKSSKKVRNVSKNSTLIPVDVLRGNQTDSRLEGIHDR